MTLAENTGWKCREIRGERGEQTAGSDRRSFEELLSTDDEILVFRRDPSTGTYQASTACCEAVLPPVN